jgi:TfoX N-terminal domain
MPYDPELADAMRKALSSHKDIEEKKMFGGYCWMLRGNMLCGVEVGRYMFRVGKELEAKALSQPGAKPMDITGRPMRGFIWVDAKTAKGKTLEDWIACAAQFVGTLPPK